MSHHCICGSGLVCIDSAYTTFMHVISVVGCKFSMGVDFKSELSAFFRVKSERGETRPDGYT